MSTFHFGNMDLNQNKEAYCRLCAELKSVDKLINLETDESKRKEITHKLLRLTAAVHLDDDLMPKTVCFVCVNSLERTVEFVSAIEQAQPLLKAVLEQMIKKDLTNDYQAESKYVQFTDKDVRQLEPEDLLHSEASVDFGDIDIKPKKLKVLVNANKTRKRSKKKQSTGSKKTLKIITSSWKEFEWTCAYCESPFSTVDNLISHSMEEHSCCNPFKCFDCNIRKVKLNGFVAHLKTHRHNLNLMCHLCYLEFPSKVKADEHIYTHSGPSEITCVGCNATFSNKEELKTHTTNFQKHTVVRLLSCKYCKEIFQKRNILAAHLRAKHKAKEKLYTCETCGKSYMHQSSLSSHYLTHTTACPYQCKICKKNFKTVTRLRDHVVVHNANKPFVCDQCGRGFRLKKQLKNHSIIHSSSKPYACSYCNKTFRFKNNLTHHLIRHSGAKPYSCDQCQSNFGYWQNYRRHMKRIHSLEIAKKKITADGVFPVNPKTGEIIKFPETTETLEWKKRVMLPLKGGKSLIFRNNEINPLEVTAK